MRHETSKNISYKDILRDLHLNYQHYFNSIFDIYEKAGIPIPKERIRYIKDKRRRDKEREKIIKKVLDFLEEESKKGYYPTGEDIKRKFGISHIWNYVTMTNLYRKLRLKPYLERKRRNIVI